MTKLYRKNAAGQIIKLPSGDILTDDDCDCCDGAGEDPCCIEPGGAPTADFSYGQTDDDPCCFQFYDNSVPGHCGNIIEWHWDFGDGSTSDEQDPLHCYEDAGPWDVTLTVVDELGCHDTVVMEVECEEPDPNCCDCYAGSLPDTVTVTFDGFAEFGGIDDCGDCFNTSFVLERDPDFPCVWRAEITCPYFEPNGLFSLVFRITSGLVDVRLTPLEFAGSAMVWEAICPAAAPTCGELCFTMTLTVNQTIAWACGFTSPSCEVDVSGGCP